ncbi:MAG: HD domain-containing protein [Spirochaetota bacterium]
MVLSETYQKAFNYAFTLHRSQKRKGSGIPYLTHLVSVSALVLENGGGETEAIAALLHDAAEDQGGEKTLKEIEDLFGKKVASIVEECSDSLTDSPDTREEWKTRKEKYLASLAHKSPEAVLVTLADKLHNARSILHDYKVKGEDLWELFQGRKTGSLWYYKSILEILDSKYASSRLLQELKHVVSEIERLSV